MGIFRFILIACMIWAVALPVAADDTIYRYEGDVHPTEQGWLPGGCEDPCSESVEDGHFVLRWSKPNDIVNYILRFAKSGGPPPPPTLWVECRFRSNHPIGPNFFTCDGKFAVQYNEVFDLVYMYGDAVISFSGDDFVLGLAVEEFHTYRFESTDGINYTFAVDGVVFKNASDTKTPAGAKVEMGGRGACDGFQNTVNEWDFVRYGTIGTGEKIIDFDTPTGIINSDHVSFKVTFDAADTVDPANYVYIDDITVEVTGGTAPIVIATRRAEGDGPDTVEIVLDRRLPPGETTTFTFDTGGPLANCVETEGEIFNCVKFFEPKFDVGTCGNKLVDNINEECDGDDDAACPGFCREDCTCPVCGDGVVDGDEQCDDAGESETCDVDCTPAVCGDGTTNVTAGEGCDNGPDNSDIVPDACRETCAPAGCGDGVLDTGEACDEGMLNSDTRTDACRTDCRLAGCGDGLIDTGEICDDGGESATCDSDCTPTECGDGTLNITAGEECDDGPGNSDAVPNACRTDCVVPKCGDSVTDTGEDCDDGAESSACNADCSLAECGDGTLNVTAGEACEDGSNNSDTVPDACRTDCTSAKCGDNVTDSSEECDGTSDDACPGECEADCSCHVPGIPAVSQWGLVAMGVLLLVFSKRFFGEGAR